jgi:hypothetical protein
MAAITFFHEPRTPHSDGDFPEPLVIQVDTLSAQCIHDVADFLLANIELRYDLGDLKTHLGARPIVIEIGGSLRVSERTFWSILVDSCPDAAQRVIRYVDAQIARTHPADELHFTSYLTVVGEDALYAYLDVHLARYDSRRGTDYAELMTVLDCFRRFVARCDLDHEVFQNDYIRMALDLLSYKDRTRFLDLLLFRFTHGQCCLGDTDFEFLQKHLTQKGILRDAVDGILTHRRGEELWAHTDVLTVCAVVYGSNFELTADVLGYCRQQMDLGEDWPKIHLTPELTLLRSLRDAYWIQRPRDLDTGFHRFSKATMK